MIAKCNLKIILKVNKVLLRFNLKMKYMKIEYLALRFKNYCIN